jgi:hypothetical protein
MCRSIRIEAAFSLVIEPSHLFAGQVTRLLHPAGKEVAVYAGLFKDVVVTDVGHLGGAGRHGIEPGPAEEGYPHISGKTVKAEEPAFPIEAIKRAVPFDRLAQVGHQPRDHGIEVAHDGLLPAGDGRDIGSDRRFAMALGYLWIVAGEQHDAIGIGRKSLARPSHATLPRFR